MEIVKEIKAFYGTEDILRLIVADIEKRGYSPQESCQFILQGHCSTGIPSFIVNVTEIKK